MATVDLEQYTYVDKSGNPHIPPQCVINVKEVAVNSEKTDSATGEPARELKTQTVCVTHGDRPVSPKKI